MADAGTVALTVGLGMAINATYDLQTGSNSTSVTLLAGGAVMGVLVIIGSTTNEWELVEAIGVLFLVGSLFVHGTKIAGLTTLVGGTTANSGLLPSPKQTNGTTTQQ